MRTPHYYRVQMTLPAILTYYRTVADRSPLPVLLYNYPQCTGYDLAIEVIAELALHGNILGIKESSGDLAKVERIIQRTRHIKRQVRTTHDFQPLTTRMIQKTANVPVGEFVAASSLGASLKQSSLHPLRWKSSALYALATKRSASRL